MERIEGLLSTFYGFSPLHSVSDYLISRSHWEAVSPQTDKPLHNDPPMRAAVLCLPEDSEQMFLGVYFSDELVAGLNASDPFNHLTDHNLDVFCVVVEEVSHFHLIANRAEDTRTVSMLELEWQGEIDKLLLAATLLADQCDDPHYLPLARKIYDDSTFVSSAERYWQATRFAAQFWYKQASLLGSRESPVNHEMLQEVLRHFYRANWQKKLMLLEDAVTKNVG